MDMCDLVQSLILLSHMVGMSFVVVVLTRLNFSQPEHLRNAVLPLKAIIADLTLHEFVSIHLRTYIVLHGYSSLIKTSGSTTKAAGIVVLLQVALCNVRSQWLASNIYIVCESANIKVCQYQVMIRNGLFEENKEQCIFSKVFYN